MRSRDLLVLESIPGIMSHNNNIDRSPSASSLSRVVKRLSGRLKSVNPGQTGSNEDTTFRGFTSTETLTRQSPRSYPETDWESMKKVIKYLYLDVDLTLEGVVDTLSKGNDFHTK